MNLTEIEIESEDGEVRKADMARCSCGWSWFMVFQIRGQDHFHLQCSACNTTFCPFGADDL